MRLQVNGNVARLVEDAAVAVGRHLDGVSALLVGGSLARREPAVSAEFPHELISDIDLIALVGAEVNSAAIREVEQRLATEIVGAKVGLVAVPAAAVVKASSFFALDLAAAMGEPLSGILPSGGFHPAPLRNRDRLELIVHQVSSTLMHTGTTGRPTDYLLRPEAAYHRLKLLLECMRALLAQSAGDGWSYGFVHQRRHDPEALFVLPARTVAELVRGRESFSAGAPMYVDARQVVTRTLAVLLGTAPETAAVLRRLLETMGDRSDLLSVYQISCLALFLMPGTPIEFAEGVLAPALSTVWAEANSDELLLVLQP